MSATISTSRRADLRGSAALSLLRWFCSSPYRLLAVVALLCHGLLLLCDYKIWDGWLVENWRRDARFDAMWRQYFEAGIPHHYFIHRFFGLSEHSVWLYKLVSVLSYYGTACGLYFMTTRAAVLNRSEALVASVFMLTIPGMLTLGEAALVPYMLGLLLFFTAGSAAIHAEHQEGGRHVLFRSLAVVLFLFALTYYALACFYLVFYLLLIWFLWCRSAVRSFGSLSAIVVRRPDYLILPLVFWKMKGWLAPTSGYYAGYNQPKIDATHFLKGSQSFFDDYLLNHLAELPYNPLFIVGIGVAGWWLSKHWRVSRPSSGLRVLALFGVGCFVVMVAGFPYLAVGRFFVAFGYSSNALQLIPIGGAIILTALVSGVRLMFAGDRQSVVASITFVYLLTSFIGMWNANYLRWQALGAKEQSLARKLGTLRGPTAPSVYIIADRAPVPKTDSYPAAVTSAQYQEFLGSRKVFAFEVPPHLVTGIPQRIGLDRLQYMMHITLMPYFFNEVDLSAPQALVLIQAGKSRADPVDVGLRYLYYRLAPFARPEDYSQFLEDLTEVLVVPIT